MKVVGPMKNVRSKRTMIEVFIISLLFVTWAAVGLHVVKEFVRNHIE